MGEYSMPEKIMLNILHQHFRPVSSSNSSYISSPEGHENKQNENFILIATHQFFLVPSESTNQAAGKLGGLLSSIAIETRGTVCIRSYSVVEKRGNQPFSPHALGGGISTVIWLQSEQLPKTSKSRTTCETFFASGLDFR